MSSSGLRWEWLKNTRAPFAELTPPPTLSDYARLAPPLFLDTQHALDVHLL